MPKVNRGLIAFQFGWSQILLCITLFTKEKKSKQETEVFLWKANISADSDQLFFEGRRGIYVMAVSINPTLIAQPQGRKLGSHVMCYVSPKAETF